MRVRLQLKGVRLEYHGTLTFFERIVEPLLAAVAQGEARGATREATPGPGASLASAEEPTSGAEDSLEATDSEPEAEAEEELAETGYRPDNANFGHFIRQLGPEAGDPDRQIVAFAFYLWNYEKREEFAEEEITGCFRSLGLSAPENAPDLYRELSERKRFLDAGAESGRWRLTQKGRNYVKTRLLGST